MGVLKVKIAGNWVDISSSPISQGGGDTPVGTIISHGGSTLPVNFLPCNGTAVSRTTYAELFAAIGTSWGVGDGSTTFNLPDLLGRAPVGAGTGSGLTARALGAKVGAESVLLTAAESGVPAHLHSVDPPSTEVVQPGTLGGTVKRIMSDYGAGSTSSAVPTQVNSSTFSGAAYVDIAAFNSANNTAAAAASAHNNMQPSAVVTFFIRAFSSSYNTSQQGLEASKPAAPPSPMRYFAVDTKREWMYDGTGWIIMGEPTQTWTPAITGVVIGTGGSAGASGWYKRGDGYCDISGAITLGTTGFSVAGTPAFILPIASSGLRTKQLTVIGVQAGGWRHPLEGDPTGGGTSGGLLYALKTDGTYLNNSAGVGASVPFAWAAGCSFEVSGRYAMQSRYT